MSKDRIEALANSWQTMVDGWYMYMLERYKMDVDTMLDLVDQQINHEKAIKAFRHNLNQAFKIVVSMNPEAVDLIPPEAIDLMNETNAAEEHRKKTKARQKNLYDKKRDQWLQNVREVYRVDLDAFENSKEFEEMLGDFYYRVVAHLEAARVYGTDNLEAFKIIAPVFLETDWNVLPQAVLKDLLEAAARDSGNII